MANYEEIQVLGTAAEQMAGVLSNLNDPKKCILYGFALGLKADNPILGATMLPPTTGTKAAV